MSLRLGRLKPVDLREVWKNEAGSFTPWLAQEDNLALLGEAIGLELELEATERYVGPFRADIVCKNTADGTFVLIENQLERTDHSHLGQLLTYAAGLSTVTIVWIAERFTDEHRAALDWLNEVTDKGIGFFGMEIELWRIGDSPVAPKFNVVSQPNDWVKSVSSVRQNEGLTDTNRLQLEYWTAFREYLHEKKSSLKPQKAQPQHWLVFSIGRAGFHISALASMRDRNIGVELVIDAPQAKSFYRALEADKEAIEAEIGVPLTWRELPDKKMSSIWLILRDVETKERNTWETQFAWFQTYVEKFYKAFAPRVRTLSTQAAQLNEPASSAPGADISTFLPKP